MNTRLNLNKWTEYAHSAYQALGDTVNIRRLAKQSVLSHSIAHYEELRSTYAESEWPAVLQELLTELAKKPLRSETYVSILARENLQDELMAHCRRYPAEILSLHRHFDQLYSAQVNDLFLLVLRSRANSASHRGAYRHVCQDLRTYAKACGKENAERLKQELQNTYRRRPAFLDELSSLRF